MNRRDIELLSAYLDGELKVSDSTRLETRLKTDPELASVLKDLRATRTLLRRLPTRKAPRNFTLTRKMVGQNPPLPRTFPAFRLATVVATLLFFFSFGINFVGTQVASQSPLFGMGGGGGPEEMQSYAAEAPMEEPAAAAPMAPEPEVASDEPGEEPSTALTAPQATMTPSAEDTMRNMETPLTKTGEAENAAGQDQFGVQSEPQGPYQLVPAGWQIGLAVVAAVGLLLMGLMRQLSARRWK